MKEVTMETIFKPTTQHNKEKIKDLNGQSQHGIHYFN